MSLIPPFDWHEVIVSPWTLGGHDTFWIVLMGFLVTASCGLIGVFLILRRMALVGDAISHSILPGLAGAFLAASFFGGHSVATAGDAHGDFRNPLYMFFGALIAGVVTTMIIEFIHRNTRVKQDAAIGITFTTLFAVGVLLITLFADKVDLDQECVLYGEIGFVTPSFKPVVEVAGHSLGPDPVVRMAAVFALTAALVLVFYKELLVTSFDSGLATSLGINSNAVHYLLMAWLSVVVVSAFESVGAILVIAMLILPGATALLLTDRLPVALWLTVIHAGVSSLVGFHLAYWLNSATAASMVVAGTGLFCVAWIFSPTQGMIARLRRGRVLEREGELAAGETQAS